MKTKILITAASLLLFSSFILPTLVYGLTLYGTTVAGGANDDGVIFQYNTATNIYTKKFDF